MTVRVLFFASLRERLRQSEASWRLPEGAKVGDLWNGLCAAHPELKGLDASIAFAVNHEYVDHGHALTDGDEVAVIPPVSGG
jgi:molybdopterin converting factor subunit 1